MEIGLSDYHMRDAATLDKITSAELHEADVWGGYLCGAADHVWTDAEWKRVAAFPKLPYVVARPDKTGTFCGLEAIMAIYKLGIPRKTAVSPDMELLFGGAHEDAITWLEDFGKVLHHFDYYVWPYGSTSYLFDLPRMDGYIVATDSKVKEQYHHPDVHATQYLFGELWDDSVIRRHAVHAYLTDNWGINH